MSGDEHSHGAATEYTGSLAKWAWLSIAAAVVTIGLKAGAYYITGSVGLLSDALESVVNLAAAILALIALTVAARPPDERHHYGHAKAEYFSAGAEGIMILFAAALIIVSAVDRLFNPQPLESLGLGLFITLVATAVNGFVGLLILRAGRRHRSITLVADGKHLLTDVWTSAGVLVGVGLVALTAWQPLDSIVAIAVALNILWTGFTLIRQSGRGLMDHALPAENEAAVLAVIERFTTGDSPVQIHEVRMREAGRDRFVQMHVLVPGDWTVSRGHDVVEEIEAAVRSELVGAHVDTHLEPLEDPRAYESTVGGLAVTE